MKIKEMAKNPKDGKLLYHITALNNLDSIFKNGLLPRNKISFDFENVADNEILGNRKKFDLANFTPFHFFCPTPFAGAAQKTNSQKDFIYITIKRGFASENQFKIVPRHPLSYDNEPLDWTKGLEKINWELMSKRDYKDHDCKECCMAEALFEGDIPANCFSYLFVKTNEIKEKVVSLLKKNNLKIEVFVNKHFFTN